MGANRYIPDRGQGEGSGGNIRGRGWGRKVTGKEEDIWAGKMAEKSKT